MQGRGRALIHAKQATGRLLDPTAEGFQKVAAPGQAFPQRSEGGQRSRPSLILTQKIHVNLHIKIFLDFSRGLNNDNNNSSQILLCAGPQHVLHIHYSVWHLQQPFLAGIVTFIAVIA
jgi:hypothetical protein